MRATLDTFVEEALPEMDPVVSYERTTYGWRGLTVQGEVLEVKSGNGHLASVPESIILAHNGIPIGRRPVTNEWGSNIGDYLLWFNRAVELHKINANVAALEAIDTTMRIAPTLRTKFNRAMILLALGKWVEGFAEYWECERYAPFMRPPVHQALSLGLQPWVGEDLNGKRLLLVHAHGHGDTIMALRFVPALKALGADVVMRVPAELLTLAAQLGAVTEDLVDADLFCPMLHLVPFFATDPSKVSSAPYLSAGPFQIDENRRRIGVAWSVGKPSIGDYPREVPLGHLMMALRDAEVHSVQVQNADQARAMGVVAHDFQDFLKCAETMAAMDQVVSVDTAALHLAGAIGHPNVVGLLSHWSSWRWLASWYQIRLVRQTAPDDWGSALRCI